MVEKLIQLMVNSGHKFTFIELVILQGHSKYTYMLYRSRLSTTDKRYRPLHRSKEYGGKVRKSMKYTGLEHRQTLIAFTLIVICKLKLKMNNLKLDIYKN